MIRKLFILAILTLIVSTTFIKNHTKKLDEEIFSIKENINYLKSVKELVQLENDYLSSPEKLLELNNLYLDNKLSYTFKKNITVVDNINEINLKNSDKNE